MKIVFIGSGEFSAPIIEALNNYFEIPLCITRPDKKRGRGKKVKCSLVGEVCDKLGIETFSPPSINNPESIEKINEDNVDVAVLASYSEILLPDVIRCFKNGIINVHPSLLPKYRGAEPVRWAIRRGEIETGVSLMLISEKLDRGNILAQETLEILSTGNNETLQKKLIDLSIKMLSPMIEMVSSGFKGIPQSQEKTFYARRMKKSDEEINWCWTAEKISRQIRSMSPNPGCYSVYNGIRVKLFEPEIIDTKNENIQPGTIIKTDKQLIISCGTGALKFSSAQREGKKKMSVLDFLSSGFFRAGDTFTFS